MQAKSPLELYTYSILPKTATGEKFDIIGTTTLEVDFGHSNWYVDCYVRHNFNYSFMIGTDFLVKSGAKVYLSMLQATIGQDKIPISGVKRPSQVQVCITESLEIPACSQVLLTGHLSGLQGTALVEPRYEIASNDCLLCPARSVVCLMNMFKGAG